MDLMSDYFQYTDKSEPPKIFHRWSLLTSVSACLGRKYWIPFGHERIFPAIYVMLMGEPATRKSTSIKVLRKLLKKAGYDNIAADKSGKEKFLIDLEGLTTDDYTGGSLTTKLDSITERHLFGTTSLTEPREVFIMADEFNDFAGVGDTQFYTTLGSFWDYDDPEKPYTSRFKTQSVSIFQPTVTILGGNTQEKFAEAFPPNIIGGGFLSRMLLIHGERSKTRLTFPPTPAETETARIVDRLRELITSFRGEAKITDPAMKLFESIYLDGRFELPDVRFQYYNGRRHSQLLKLCLTVSACYGEDKITDEHVVTANTILAAAEANMSTALGEFGKSKNSATVNVIMNILDSTLKALTIQELWQFVDKDLERVDQLVQIMQNLQHAGKVQVVEKGKWLPRRSVKKKLDFVDFSILTEEEQGML